MTRVRDKLVFFGSYYDALIDLEGEDYEVVSKALLKYMFCDEEPDLTGWHKAVFLACKANVDVSKGRAKSGKLGGEANRKQNGSKPEANLKQIESKTEAKRKQNGSTRLDQTRLDQTRLEDDKTNEHKRVPRFTDPDLEKVWSDFVEMRKKKRAPMTAHAEDLMEKKLRMMASDGNGGIIPGRAIAILEQSVMNAWSDIWEIKTKTGNTINWDIV